MTRCSDQGRNWGAEPPVAARVGPFWDGECERTVAFASVGNAWVLAQHISFLPDSAHLNCRRFSTGRGK